MSFDEWLEVENRKLLGDSVWVDRYKDAMRKAWQAGYNQGSSDTAAADVEMLRQSSSKLVEEMLTEINGLRDDCGKDIFNCLNDYLQYLDYKNHVS